MRELLLEITDGYDVLYESSTIASVCMRIFRAKFLKHEHLSVVPERGYERNERHSRIAINYFNWLMHQQPGLRIQHAANGGEKVVPRLRGKPYKLDGYVQAENRAIEFLGCEFHGCPTCFAGRMETLCANKKTAQNNYSESMERLEYIRAAGYRVQAIWECEVRALLKSDVTMRRWFEDQPDYSRIDPRDAYSGGRTGPRRLYAEADGAETRIACMDIVSLYPYVNYTTEYPVGVPQFIQPDEHHVHWTRPEDIPVESGQRLRGLFKVRVLAPQDRRLLVLPVKVDDRLLFCSCPPCAKAFKSACTREAEGREYCCTHSDNERRFVTTVTSLELEEALQSGYVVDRFYRAWHYTQWDGDLFKDYVRIFLKLKVVSSGWRKNIPELADCESEEERRRLRAEFCADYHRLYGIIIDEGAVVDNPGMRHIAKLCLNSLWGKFSMRNDLSHTEVFTSPAEFYARLHDRRVEVGLVIPISDEAIRVVYRDKEEFLREHRASNIVLSLWTTSAARLTLLRYMRQASENGTLIYTDTDSVFYVYRVADGNPIKAGRYLGEMSEEYSDYDILEFACAGAKQYGLKLCRKSDGVMQNVLKIRGITLDSNSCRRMNYEHFKRMVLNYGGEENVPFEYKKFGPQQDSRILCRVLCRIYRTLCQKGIITRALDVIDFGYLNHHP
jgi:hypothetical protein